MKILHSVVVVVVVDACSILEGLLVLEPRGT